jgi:hypothetical protein
MGRPLTHLLTGLILLHATTWRAAAQPQAPREIPGAIGPYVNLKPEAFRGVHSFGSHDKIVMTHYFYWYDITTKAHIVNGDGSDALTTHPLTLNGFSYKSVNWHKKQLLDMMEAGIDVVLPVYWGAPSDHAVGAQFFWSFEGLRPLVRACQELIGEGRKPPAIGLFYDTSTLQYNSWGVHVDLTTEFGKRWFYASIRDFFSLIPPQMWAMIDNNPVVVLYSASFARAHDQACIDYVKSEFPREFGGRVPFIIREVSWRVKADATCAWGGAVKPKFTGVAEIGPGYDHSAVPGRRPLIVPREDGKFYEKAWLQVLRRSPHIVILETWNEFHEGTNIAESREDGRKYIDLTRRYVDQFKKGVVPPPPPEGPFRGARAVEMVLGRTNKEEGLKQVEHEDGRTIPAIVGGQDCRVSHPGSRDDRYIYFQIDESFKWSRAMDVVVVIEYFDGDRGRFSVQYDSHDPTATSDGAYKDAPQRVSLGGSRVWKKARFVLDHAKFDGSQNAGADFRIAVDGPELAIQKVTLSRATPP